MLTPEALVASLRDSTFQVRTGVLLAPARATREGPDVSAHLGVDWIDLVHWKLKGLVPGSRYLGLNAATLLQDFTAVANEPHVTSCALIGNADVLLARLPYKDRGQVWEFLFQDFRKRPVGVVILLPDAAGSLFSPGHRKRWEDVDRLAVFGAGGESSE